MSLFIIFLVIFELFVAVKSELSCYSGHTLCEGTTWCCPDGYVCTGTPTCLSMAAIIGGVGAAIVGLIILICIGCVFCRYNCWANQDGTIHQQTISHPVVYNKNLNNDMVDHHIANN